MKIIKIENKIEEATTIHWHGMHVSSENDGGPHTVIDSGAIWNPKFKVMDHAATYWYHPHLHEKTNELISSAVLVSNDPEKLFGDLYEIKCRPYEIFVNAATTSDVVVVSALTPATLQS